MTDIDLEYFRHQAETDTGFFCRHVLGMTESPHWKTGEMIEGGVRSDGPHKEMTEFFDNEDTRRKHLEAPRGSYKTSVMQGFVMRKVLQNPNLRVLYGMDTYGEALKCLYFIREQLATNPIIQQVWGKQKSNHWNLNGFTILGRTKVSKEPTFSAFGVDKNVTGMHYDIIIADDLVTKDTVRTKDGIQKTLLCFNALAYLLDPGGILVETGTRYHDDDLHGHILNNLDKMFESLVIDCGLDWEVDEAGRPHLVGESKFPHLSKEFLLSQFEILNHDLSEFSSQYMNKCVSSATMLFKRSEFVVEGWKRFMENLSVYLLVDTATKDGEENCYSCGLVVGLDSRGDAYVMDAFCGLFDPMTTTSQILTMVETWDSKNPIRKVVMENSTANQVFRPMIEMAAKQLGLKVHIEPVSRGHSASSKKQRISGLQGWFQQRRIHFVTTLPRNYFERGKMKDFFQPEGYGEGLNIMPGGELVDQFIRWPSYGRNDLADALADLNAVDGKGVRVCAYGSRRREERATEKRRRSGMVVPIPTRVNGRVVMVDALVSSDQHGKTKSWISQYKRHG